MNTNENTLKEFPTLFQAPTLLQQAINYLSESDKEVVKLRKLETICEEGCNILTEQKLIVIIKWKNQKWQPNFQDPNEPKYFIWWDLEKNCFHYVRIFYRITFLSSRLCFKYSQTVEELVKIEEFELLLKQYYNY